MKRVILLCLMVLIFLYLTLMLQDVKEFIGWAKQVLAHEIVISEDDPYANFGIPRNTMYFDAVRVESEFKVMYVIHNFREGRMCIDYTNCYYDCNDKQVLYLSNREIWNIRKINGRWQVISAKVEL